MTRTGTKRENTSAHDKLKTSLADPRPTARTSTRRPTELTCTRGAVERRERVRRPAERGDGQPGRALRRHVAPLLGEATRRRRRRAPHHVPQVHRVARGHAAAARLSEIRHDVSMRSSAQGNCSAKSLAGNVVNSSLSSLSSRRGSSRGGGIGGRGRDRGHFIHLAIYCTTTWCFALKGLRTMRTVIVTICVFINVPSRREEGTGAYECSRMRE